MNITQVTPGLISIPPNGWGAIEKIIWEYKLNLESLGNVVDIKYLNDVSKSDIVHIHVANLALEAAERGIPYIFSLHDHHVYHYGKLSPLYEQNLEAIKKSIISFTHAEFLVDFFDETDKLFYLSHGVNTSYFKPNDLYRSEHKLLCLANNGFANNQSFDRKGFRFAIEAAKELNLPITIVGPPNNKNFFDNNSDLLEYNKLNIVYHNPTEDEILKIYQDHSIFIHPSMLEAGHPNLTLLEAISCGLPVVGTYDGSKKIGGLVKINRSTNSVKEGIQHVLNNYEYYVNLTQETKIQFDWSVISKRLYNMYESVLNINKEYSSEVTKTSLIKTFEETPINTTIIENENIEVFCHFINQPFVEIRGNSNKKFRVEFWDDKGNLVFQETISSNMWVRTNKEYFILWTIKVYCEKELIYNYTLDYTGKRVYIALDSKSLGDSIAWIPYAEEFRKKHKCYVVVSTFWNDLFKKTYPMIEFVKPATVVHNLHGMYTIGCFLNENKEPEKFNILPLQKVASNILGLEHHEVKTKIHFLPDKNKRKGKKYVTIGYHSTAGLKYWNNPTGWQELTDFLISNGYDVLNLSLDPCGVKGVEELKDKSMNNIMNLLYHSEFFIGISSGLSWLAWGLGKHVVMISNMTNEEHEFQTNVTRIVNKSVCNSCWNDPNHVFDKGDWNWCPLFKGTDRQFECTKKITGEMVVSQIRSIIR